MFIIEYKKKSNQVKDNLSKILEGKFDEVIEDPEQIIWTNEKDYTNFKFSLGDFIKANAQDGNVVKVFEWFFCVVYWFVKGDFYYFILVVACWNKVRLYLRNLWK